MCREWSRVPDEEKASVRMAVLQLMLSDASDRVALQLGLLASNICAFDFPGRCEVAGDAGGGGGLVHLPSREGGV
jgi:hypothetical protein